MLQRVPAKAPVLVLLRALQLRKVRPKVLLPAHLSLLQLQKAPQSLRPPVPPKVPPNHQVSLRANRQVPAPLNLLQQVYRPQKVQVFLPLNRLVRLRVLQSLHQNLLPKVPVPHHLKVRQLR